MFFAVLGTLSGSAGQQQQSAAAAAGAAALGQLIAAAAAAQHQGPALPQLILASGQLVQGIQGAQLLIPTSQGNSTL